MGEGGSGESSFKCAGAFSAPELSSLPPHMAHQFLIISWANAISYISINGILFSSSFQTRNLYVSPGPLSPILLPIIKSCAFYMWAEDSNNSHLSNTLNLVFLLPTMHFPFSRQSDHFKAQIHSYIFPSEISINVTLLSTTHKHNSPFKSYCLLFLPLSSQSQFYKTVPLAVLSTCYL